MIQALPERLTSNRLAVPALSSQVTTRKALICSAETSLPPLFRSWPVRSAGAVVGGRWT
jgi:hypothetical protein